ncbi:MAG: cyanophycin synthetase, partial [Patescibacteria group bacterium]
FSVSNRNYELALLGAHNVTNALAAIATASALGLDYESIKEGLEKVTGVPGRMEMVKASEKYSVFVDYAHDEVSLRAILELANKIKKTRIIILIGAEGGGRDKKKRPRMGQVAAELADFVVVSNVDPYDDDPQEIIESITQAAEKNGKVRNKNLFPIEDRREGIQKALSLAHEDDVVIITGKGAEQSMIIKNRTIPWDDREVVRQELEKITFDVV